MILRSLEFISGLILYSRGQKGATTINDSLSNLIWLKVGRNIDFHIISFKDDQYTVKLQPELHGNGAKWSIK